jgi:hypothetical protein
MILYLEVGVAGKDFRALEQIPMADQVLFLLRKGHPSQ